MLQEVSGAARGYLPQLPLSERDRRWALVREYMANEHLDALVVHGSDTFYGYATANLRYLTHVGSTQGALCIFPLEGEPVVFTGPRHMSVPFNYYSKAQIWVTDLRPLSGTGGVLTELKARGLDRGSLGIVGYSTALVANTIPHALYAQLAEGLPGARIRDVTAGFSYLRLIKSRPEIDMLYTAGELARKTVLQLWESARPGVTEARVFADMLHCQIINGGEPHTFFLVTSGPVDDSGEWHLLHPEAVPGAPTMRPLAQGDLVITEFHANYGGYLAAAEFSMYLGRPPRAAPADSRRFSGVLPPLSGGDEGRQYLAPGLGGGAQAVRGRGAGLHRIGIPRPRIDLTGVSHSSLQAGRGHFGRTRHRRSRSPRKHGVRHQHRYP